MGLETGGATFPTHDAIDPGAAARLVAARGDEVTVLPTSVRFTERHDEIGARPSIATIADSYDDALAETTNGLYKAECVYWPDTNGSDDVDHLELPPSAGS